jgi:CRP-like cAMP-binding protein
MLEDRDAQFELLICKLSRLQDLDAQDIEALRKLPLEIENVGRLRQLIRERDEPTRCCILLKGFAARHKVVASGARQIVSFHIPGDILDIQHLLLGKADHSVETITSARIGWIPKADLLEVAWQKPNIGKALWRDCLIDASIFREWVLNVGRRDAKSRIAHMLCEFVLRCEAAGLGDRHNFELPMTQTQIGDATGMTPVHVNRMLKVLDTQGAVARDRNRFEVVNWDQLCRIADFDPVYLHSAAA